MGMPRKCPQNIHNTIVFQQHWPKRSHKSRVTPSNAASTAPSPSKPPTFNHAHISKPVVTSAPVSISEQLLPLPSISSLRKTAPPVLDADDLVRALLARANPHRVLIARLGACLQHLALLALARVGAARVRELEGRCAGELEQQLRLAALVDVDAGLAALGEAH